VTSIARPPVYRIAIMQFFLSIIIALIALIYSFEAGYSALLGGLTCAIPNGYLIWRSFRYSGARSVGQVVQSFYQGESGKYILTVVCFAVIFSQVRPLVPWALFGAFIIVHFSHVMAARIAKL
jgi:ATP synthase protein I